MLQRLAIFALFLVPFAGAACGDKAEETGAPVGDGGGTGDTDTDGGDSGDSGDDGETGVEPPVDADGDGYFEDEDCDDTNEAIFPGAEETWDDVDQDCDGRVDGDGSFTGDLAVRAVAVREGVTYGFDLICPMTLSRTLGQLDYSATCTPNPDDPDAMDLIGETMSFRPRVNGVTGQTWDERSVIESSNGWDTFGSAEATWTDWDTVSFQVSLDTISLDMSGTATLIYAP